jgi:hypothetical protein
MKRKASTSTEREIPRTKPVRLVCPKTSATFKGLLKNETDWLARHWQQSLRVACPRCGGEHSFVVKEVYLSEAIADDKTIPNLFAA